MKYPRGHASGPGGPKHCFHLPDCIGIGWPDNSDELGCCQCGIRAREREAVKEKVRAMPKAQPSPLRPKPSPVPAYEGGDLSPEGPSSVTHPKTGRQQSAFLKGSLTGSGLTAVLAALIQLASMWREDRREEREALRLAAAEQRAHEDTRELRELRARIVETTKQPWAAVAVDGGVR